MEPGVDRERDAGPHPQDGGWTADLYRELRRLARGALRWERPGRTLQTTDLAHEVFLRLSRERRSPTAARAPFLAAASIHIRRFLVDRARARSARRRGGDRLRVALPDELAARSEPGVDVLALDEALTRLDGLNAEHARIVELRFFGGLDWSEVAEELGLARRTVLYHWEAARGWLRWQLDGERGR